MTEKRDAEMTAAELFRETFAPLCDVDWGVFRVERILAAGREQGEERGKLVTCPTCKGEGTEPNEDGAMDPCQTNDCPDCHGSGKVRRELAGVLEACAWMRSPDHDSYWHENAHYLEAWARKRWG